MKFFGIFLLLFLFGSCVEVDETITLDNEETQETQVIGDQVLPPPDISGQLPPPPSSRVSGTQNLDEQKGLYCDSLSSQIEVKVQQASTTHFVTPAGEGNVNYQGNITTLRAVVSNANSGDVILLGDGEYTFNEASGGSFTGIYITQNDLIIKGASGDPANVILNSRYLEHGSESATITINGSGAIIADLTVRESIHHLIHVWDGGDDVTIHNVYMINGGQQFLKASPGSGRANGAQITCNLFGMDQMGRRNVYGYGASDGSTRCYTGGIDAHQSNNWSITDNYFEGIYCDGSLPHPLHGKAPGSYVGGLAEHAIHLWDTDAGTTHTIERNRIVDCARGIGIGLGDTNKAGSAIIRNNMIVSNQAASSEHDVGIIVEAISDAQIYNNTVMFTHPSGYPNAIEYRFTGTNAKIWNNLTNKTIRNRNSANGEVQYNYTQADTSLFKNANTGELDLNICSSANNIVLGQGKVILSLVDDFYLQSRVNAIAPDIGAFQCP